jgi:hypothetical protein
LFRTECRFEVDRLSEASIGIIEVTLAQGQHAEHSIGRAFYGEILLGDQERSFPWPQPLRQVAGRVRIRPSDAKLGRPARNDGEHLVSGDDRPRNSEEAIEDS